MGLNVGSINSANLSKQIDAQALAKVTEQILNPNSEKKIDVSKLDLSKFNRVSIGTDFYAERTTGQVVLNASKAHTDFDVNLSKNFNINIQYLNSVAAQSLFTEKENNGKIVANIDSLVKPSEEAISLEASNIMETKNMNKDKRGSNPFAFYFKLDNNEEPEDIQNTGSINIVA